MPRASSSSSLLRVAATALAAASSAVAQSPPRLTLEPCEAAWAGEAFVAPAVGVAGPITQGSGMCVDFDSSSLILAKCSASAQQTWMFHADGTVHNGADVADCWNAFGGSTAPGTQVVMYACDSAAKIAANDLFWALPAQGQIVANESGLCLSSTQPPAPPPPSPTFYCQLNGEYDPVLGTCNCYAPWTGTNCSILAVLPARPVPSGYGMKPNVTAWGGSALFFEGKFHAVVAEIIEGCPLSNWGSNSQCSHIVADSVEGPYTYSEAAVPVWCHNPALMTFYNGTQQTFALFHIGTGAGGSPKNCSAGEDGAVDDMAAPPADAGSTLHIATSPYGPWTPATPPPSCNNPSPWLAANGTWFLLCDSRTLFSAPTVLGPWTQLTTLNPSGGVPGNYEDAHLFIDPRGFFHVIFHIYTTNIPPGLSCVDTTVSGHYFSADAFTWYASDDQPLGSVIDFADGTSWQLSTRERPKLFFDAVGNPTHIMNGVCYGASSASPTVPCVNMKYDFATAWLVQPLNMNP
jgi:hypothetical protein